MKTYVCKCGAGLFFGNTVCTACGAAVGWCDECSRVVTFEIEGDSVTCANPECGSPLVRCVNFGEHQICTCCLKPPAEGEAALCRSCRLTETIPDLTVPENVRRWRKLEIAKQRLLYELHELGLPYDAASGATTPLRFQFKADTDTEQVLTGHADGIVTINLAEADSVQREMLRQQFGEPQRTLIGHFRHEVGHYYWMILVAGRRDEEFATVFGNADDPPYADALARYYAEGPKADWPQTFISAYASSHPWEDFAETFAYYLDLRAILATVHHHFPKSVKEPKGRPLAELLVDYLRVGIIANELNRTMGLLDLLPEVVAPAVLPKLEMVHALVEEVAEQKQVAAPPLPPTPTAPPAPTVTAA